MKMKKCSEQCGDAVKFGMQDTWEVVVEKHDARYHDNPVFKKE